MLEPADKASSNVIVVCTKYYLDVVIKKLGLNSTYKEVYNNNVNIISRLLDYKVKNGSMYKNNMNSYHHSTGYLSCTKNFMVSGSLMLPINALQNIFHHYLLLVLNHTYHYKQTIL